MQPPRRPVSGPARIVVECYQFSCEEEAELQEYIAADSAVKAVDVGYIEMLTAESADVGPLLIGELHAAAEPLRLIVQLIQEHKVEISAIAGYAAKKAVDEGSSYVMELIRKWAKDKRREDDEIVPIYDPNEQVVRTVKRVRKLS
ncbi:MAG: hypothetical protein ABSD43_03055 [Terracidiphilus sp.]|jgi:hypothetical protein